jgi:predicted permease
MRHLRRAPLFTAAAVLTLATGIGATVAMFSVYWRVILNPVTAPDAPTLMAIARVTDPATLVPPVLSWPRVQALQNASRTFSAVGAYATASVSWTPPGDLPQELRGVRVSNGFFDAIRVAPLRGRLFTAADDVPNGPAVCLLSYEVWQARFGGRDMAGTTLRLDGRSTEIVGILPPHMSAPWSDREVFLPRVFDDAELTPESVALGASYLSVVGRLAPGRTAAQADDELRVLSHDFAGRFPGRSDTIAGLEVRPLGDVLADARRPALTVLLAAVGLVLLVSCANTAALFLSRLVSRQRETAIRQALGASRSRIVLAFLGESLTLALLAGIVGVALGSGALSIIRATLGSDLPPAIVLRVEGASLIVAVGAGMCAAVLVGLVPALQVTRSNAASVTSFARGLSETASTHRLRGGLVVCEVALSAFLLVGAVLFLSSLARLRQTPVGFDAGGIAAGAITLPSAKYATAERQAAFFTDVVDRVRQLPQVTGAAIGFGLPFDNDNFVSPYVIGGRPIPPAAERARAGLRIVGDGYFQVMRMRIVAGRAFTAADKDGSENVCIINESLALREFRDRSPLDATILRGRDAKTAYRIVGVVGDVRTNGPGQPVPEEIFFAFRQLPRPNAAIVVRTASRPDAIALSLQAAAGAVDPSLPVAQFATLEQKLSATLGPDRIVATLISAFAFVAMLLASIGLYAVLAHSVAARTVEIGIRMAIGADRRSILRLVVSDGLRLVAIGIVCGLAAALAASRFVAAQLHDVSAHDPLVYAMVALIFVVVGVTASALPARRAARVDPLVSLSAP